MPNLSYALWSIWIELPLLHKLFFIFLFAVAVYSLFSAAQILAGVRSLMAFGQSRDVPALQNDVAALYARSANVRHLITATFYLFGIVFFWGLRFTLWTPDGKTSVFSLVLGSRANVLKSSSVGEGVGILRFFWFHQLHQMLYGTTQALCLLESSRNQ
jgi:hypothetical protein